MNMQRHTLEQWADSLGLDLVGIADIAHYQNVEPQWNPLSILPKAKSVVVFGRSIPRSYFRGIEEGTLWMRVNRYLSPRPGYSLCRLFEDQGFLAVPSSPIAPQRWPDGVVFKEGKPAPNVTPDIYVAAQLAGLGEVGYNGAFLTPEFGVRQALGMLFTEAAIEPNMPFESGRLCPGEDCLACVKACPAGALSAIPVSKDIGDRTIRVGQYTDEACAFCVNGAFPDTSCKHAPPNRLAAACTRACMAHLEDSGTVDTGYRNKFRRREPWAFDTFEA